MMGKFHPVKKNYQERLILQLIALKNFLCRTLIDELLDYLCDHSLA